MAGKNHIIESFRVSDETCKTFDEVAKKTNLKKTDLSRLLFNRALSQLKATAMEVGWDNLQFSVKELN